MVPTFADWIGRLQRCKWLQHFQVFDARYLITLDGSQYFSSELVKCKQLRPPKPTSRAIIMTWQADRASDKRQVLPLAPEFIRNSDGREQVPQAGRDERRLPDAGAAPWRLSPHGGNVDRVPCPLIDGRH